MNARQTRLDVAGDRPPPPLRQAKGSKREERGGRRHGAGAPRTPHAAHPSRRRFQRDQSKMDAGGGPSGFILRIAAQVAPGNEWAPSSSLR
eukprot:scaffold22979_cov46-Tisochrysis_lutea.AAC.1